MDYEVFMLARIREEYLRTHDNTEAVGWGLEHTARIITSARAHHGHRLRRVRVRVAGADQSDGLRARVRGHPRRHGDPSRHGPGDDAADGRLELVDPKWLDRILPKVSIEEEVAYEMPEVEPATAR